MKQRLIGLGAAALVLIALVVSLVARGQATAHSAPHLDYGAQLNAAACGQSGAQVLDVTLKVINDPDSSVTGHSWARDTFNKRIQVWQTGASDFCAVVRYEGSFVTVAGNSPQDTSASIVPGITGDIHGGYRALFSGAPVASPGQPTHGDLGTFDYGWDGTDAGALHLTTFDWSIVYFGTDNINLFWWGWIYQAPGHGTWVNACGVAEQGNTACPGNAGDIV
ncbi:MAG TPA: hypothetical protein VGR57_04830 [Ktedonobacterales bacterium]|nr:hypothetical protein [Ktedonobacterales bacterium]